MVLVLSFINDLNHISDMCSSYSYYNYVRAMIMPSFKNKEEQGRINFCGLSYIVCTIFYCRLTRLRLYTQFVHPFTYWWIVSCFLFLAVRNIQKMIF